MLPPQNLYLSPYLSLSQARIARLFSRFDYYSFFNVHTKSMKKEKFFPQKSDYTNILRPYMFASYGFTVRTTRLRVETSRLACPDGTSGLL